MGVTVTSRTRYTSFRTYLEECLPHPYGVNEYYCIYKEERVKVWFFSEVIKHEVGYITDSEVTLYTQDNPDLVSMVTKIAEKYSNKTGKDINIEIIKSVHL